MTAATVIAATTRPATLRARSARLVRPSVRRALVRRVRAEIAAGSYVTEVKIDLAAARLLRRVC